MYASGSERRQARNPVRRPSTRAPLPRISSSESGFFFCGINEEPVVTSSPSVRKPASWLAKKIQSSANSLLGIINDILDFSKIEAGKMDMEAVEFNLDDVLDNLANLITVKAQEKKNLE